MSVSDPLRALFTLCVLGAIAKVFLWLVGA